MQLPGLTIGIIADDMTGANDTALQFFLAGAKTEMVLDPAQIHTVDKSVQVWSLTTESRHLEVREAVAAVKRATAMVRNKYGVENFYKKMDSTLRGHFGHECLAMLDELKWDCAVIAPAYPAQHRRTVGGYQLVQGIPIEHSEVAYDPLFPVSQSHIPTMLNAIFPDIVRHIELSTVLRGAGPVLKALMEWIHAGKRLVTIDACSPIDMEQIALAIEKGRKHAKILPCGSAGLAQALSRFWVGEAIISHAQPTFKPSPILMLMGSNSQINRDQIRELQGHYDFYGNGSELTVLSLPIEYMLDIEQSHELLPLILDRLNERNTVVVSSCLDPNAVAQTLEIAEQSHISPEQVSRRVAESLAALASDILKEKQVKLVLSGGETAKYVCRGIGAKSLKMVAEVEASIPLLYSEPSDIPAKLPERWIVTKSGNFGNPLTLANIVSYFKQRENGLITLTLEKDGKSAANIELETRH